MSIYGYINNGLTTYEWILRKRGKNKIKDLNEEEVQEDEIPDSNGRMSRRGSKPSSVNLYRSKIVHKKKK